MPTRDAGSTQNDTVRRSKRRRADAQPSTDHEPPRRKAKKSQKCREPARLPAEIWIMIIHECFQILTDQELWLKLRPLNRHCKELVEIYAASSAGINKCELKTRMETQLLTYVGYAITDVNEFFSASYYPVGYFGRYDLIRRNATQALGDAPALWYIPRVTPENSLRRAKPWLYHFSIPWKNKPPSDEEIRQRGIKTHWHARPRHNANRVLKYQGVHPQHRHLAVYTLRTPPHGRHKSNCICSEPDSYPARKDCIEPRATELPELKAAVRYWKAMRENGGKRRPPGNAYPLCISVPSYEAAEGAMQRNILISSRDYIEVVPETAEVTINPNTELPTITCTIDWCKVWTLQCLREKTIEERLFAAVAHYKDLSLQVQKQTNEDPVAVTMALRQSQRGHDDATYLLRWHRFMVKTPQDEEEARSYSRFITKLVLTKEGLKTHGLTQPDTDLYHKMKDKYTPIGDTYTSLGS